MQATAPKFDVEDDQGIVSFDNPFLGTSELNGLRVMMSLLNLCS
jgi:hypothetical protein